jgi:hypothetical protein
MTRPTLEQATAPERAKLVNSDWFPVVAFSAIGFLIFLNLMLRFPDWGAVIAQMNQIGG